MVPGRPEPFGAAAAAAAPPLFGAPPAAHTPPLTTPFGTAAPAFGLATPGGSAATAAFGGSLPAGAAGAGAGAGAGALFGAADPAPKGVAFGARGDAAASGLGKLGAAMPGASAAAARPGTKASPLTVRKGGGPTAIVASGPFKGRYIREAATALNAEFLKSITAFSSVGGDGGEETVDLSNVMREYLGLMAEINHSSDRLPK